MKAPSRRRVFGTALAGLGATALAGCDRPVQSGPADRVLRNTEHLTMNAQRALQARGTLAAEFRASDLSRVFRANGTRLTVSEEYERLMHGKFAD